MVRKVAPVLAEMLAAIDGIQVATASKSVRDMESDWLLRHGVQRGLEVISEASRHLPQDLKDRYPEIPWLRIAGIGNVLRHEYHGVSNTIVWNVVTEHLPPLRVVLLAMQRDNP